MDPTIELARFLYDKPRSEELKRATIQKVISERGERTIRLASEMSATFENESILDIHIALCIVTESVRWSAMRGEDAETRFQIDLLLQGIKTQVQEAGAATADMVEERQAEIGPDALRAEAAAAMRALRRKKKD